MKTSSNKDIQQLYDETAGSYNLIMDAEIYLPIYSDILALTYEEEYLIVVIEKSGFDTNQCKLEYINEMEMNAIYIEQVKYEMSNKVARLTSGSMPLPASR